MSEPTKISIPWARDDGTKATIPETSQIGIADGRASFPDGFVPLNGTPKAAGGIPPFKQDMNGILYAITNVLKWTCSGGMFKRDATFQSAISGYPQGAVLLKSDNSGLWFNTTDGNTTNPDAGGAGWQHIDPRLYANAGGTTSAYTATFDPAITVLTNALTVYLDTTSVGTNTTTTPTFSTNGLTALTIKRQGGVALIIGDLPQRAILQYDSVNTCWLLLNPLNDASNGYQSITTNSAITASYAGKIISVNGGVTVTLPALSTVRVGVPFTFISGTTGLVTIQRAGSDTFSISGSSASTTLTKFSDGGFCTIWSDGTHWRVQSSREVFNRSIRSGASGDVCFFPNNLVMQFGTALTNAGGQVAVTFPLTFDTHIRNIVNPVGGNFTVGNQNSASTSGFNHNIVVANTLGAAAANNFVGWVSFGYIGS